MQPWYGESLQYHNTTVYHMIWMMAFMMIVTMITLITIIIITIPRSLWTVYWRLCCLTPFSLTHPVR